ncbi:FKBP-type peptidyl-prolyl cis-trans isomerase [Nocardioides sp. GY 10127]|uniref:FKBP-type peptidyl-prolyl cis-trans isomerase n=1 Tax=Nocardioides sp. GY 10127 TaxID=2569762 RepID=UPI0010A7C7E5|nr:FKBP-type peptidyl-prolyl cis-trans isomerase [Nocardioides sp. GY 10127]TIC86485.1 FKBP-type peptidyl-prolyl cis-trans isomerase [Nocardioides sp. GY 10127]
MSRPNRPLRMMLVPVLAMGAFAACGSDSDDASDSASDSISVPADTGDLTGLTVTGDVGSAPKVDISDDFAADGLAYETTVEGDGLQITSDDLSSAFIQYVIVNGNNGKTVYSTYDQDSPEVLDISTDGIPAALSEPLTGQHVGSRVVVTDTVKDIFGSASSTSLNMKNKDPLVLIFDVIGPQADMSDQAFDTEASGWLPGLTLDDDGVPTAMDFTDVPEPTGKLEVDTIIEGDGEAIKKGDTVMANYLGQVYGADDAFDSSFDGTPAAFQIAEGSLIDGWVEGLEGVTVGSRVWLQIPPGKGYGKSGNSSAGIEGDDTLYFVIDILAVSS